jgi:hypothetical protein
MLDSVFIGWGFIVERLLMRSGVSCWLLSTNTVSMLRDVMSDSGNLFVLPVLTQGFTGSSTQVNYANTPLLEVKFSLFSTAPITTTNERI